MAFYRETVLTEFKEDDACGAWEQIDECRPDMVLLNCLSEDFDSYELLIDIKRRHPGYPVLVYTVINHETIDDLKERISGLLNEMQPKDLNKNRSSDFTDKTIGTTSEE